MMPELGRRMVHAEAVELLREWIASMPPDLRRNQAPESHVGGATAAAPALGR